MISLLYTPNWFEKVTAFLCQGVTEDTPLWDEDDALEEAEKKTAAGKPAAKQAAAAKKVPAATGAIIPSAKKAKAKAQAAKNSEEATKVCATAFTELGHPIETNKHGFPCCSSCV